MPVPKPLDITSSWVLGSGPKGRSYPTPEAQGAGPCTGSFEVRGHRVFSTPVLGRGPPQGECG